MPRKDKYLIEGLWPRKRTNLIAGASGAGKTRFIVPWLFDMLDGKPILGRVTTKLDKIAYIACDRTAEDAQDTMSDLGHDPSRLFLFSFMDNEMEWRLSKVVEVIPPGTQFTFIEAIGALVEHAKINDYHEVLRFGRSLNKAMRTSGSDFSGSTHVPKMRQDENFKHSRENIFGAASWAGFCGTIIVIDELGTGQRQVDILTRDGESQKLTYEFNESGQLIQSSQVIGKVLMDRWFDKLPPESDLTTSMMHEAGERCRCSRASITRWISESCTDGKIMQMGRGIYRKRNAQ